MSQSWEELRRTARQTERELDSRLVSYANASSMSSIKNSVGGVGGSRTLEIEIESLLSSLTKTVENMANILERQYPSSQAGTMNPSMMHALQKHRDQLYDYSREFRRIKSSVVAAREHSELLGSVRQDIDEYKSSSQSASANEALINERRRIDGVNRMTDSIIDTAYETRSALINQRNSLMNSSKRTGSVFNQLPSVGQLIAKIQARKRRDAIIMGLVIGICIALILMYMMGSPSTSTTGSK